MPENHFFDTLKILRTRGDAMQNSVPKGQGGMVAVLGSTVEAIEKIVQKTGKTAEQTRQTLASKNPQQRLVPWLTLCSDLSFQCRILQVGWESQ